MQNQDLIDACGQAMRRRGKNWSPGQAWLNVANQQNSDLTLIAEGGNIISRTIVATDGGVDLCIAVWADM